MAFIARKKISSIEPWETCSVYREPRALNFKPQVFTLLECFQELRGLFCDPTGRTFARTLFERQGLYEPGTRVQFWFKELFSMLVPVVHVDIAVRVHYLYEANHRCEFRGDDHTSSKQFALAVTLQELPVP